MEGDRANSATPSENESVSADSNVELISDQSDADVEIISEQSYEHAEGSSPILQTHDRASRTMTTMLTNQRVNRELQPSPGTGLPLNIIANPGPSSITEPARSTHLFVEPASSHVTEGATSTNLRIDSRMPSATRTTVYVNPGQSSITQTTLSASLNIDPGLISGTSVSTSTNLDRRFDPSSQSASIRLSGIDRLVAETESTSSFHTDSASTDIPLLDSNLNSNDTHTHVSDTLAGTSISDSSMKDFHSPKKYTPSVDTLDKQSETRQCTENEEEDGQCCPICFDQWTNSGRHRLVSLRCGHLFGQSCIERWLGGQRGKCPQCNKKARKREIRVIYAKSLKVVDTSEKDEAMRQLEKERKSRHEAELQAAKTRLLLQMARDECRRLTEEIHKHKQQLEHYTNTAVSGAMMGSSTTSRISGQFVLQKTLKISDTPDCRVLSFCPAMATLCVSQCSSNALFPGFGVKKVNVFDFKTSQYVAIHSKMIRDMSVSQQDNVLLSASMDKTVKVTSLSSNTVIQTYTLPAPVWSCTWDKDNPLYFYAGMQNGVVHVYDTRNTTTHVQLLSTETSRSPVVGMQYLKYNSTSSFSGGGLIVGQLDRTSLFEKQSNDYKSHLLPLEGNLTSLSVDDGSRHILATYRPTQRHPTVRHVLYELSVDVLTDAHISSDRLYTCNGIHTLHGGSTMKILAKSQLTAHPTGKGGLIVAGDEASRCLHVWDASNGSLSQKMPISSAVIDVRSVLIDSGYHLVALSDRQIHIYKWSS